MFLLVFKFHSLEKLVSLLWIKLKNVEMNWRNDRGEEREPQRRGSLGTCHIIPFSRFYHRKQQMFKEIAIQCKWQPNVSLKRSASAFEVESLPIATILGRSLFFSTQDPLETIDVILLCEFYGLFGFKPHYISKV